MPLRRPRLPASGWKRWLALLGVLVGSFFLLLVLLALGIWGAFQIPEVQGWFFAKMVQMGPPATPEEMPGRPGVVPTYAGPVGDARFAASADDLFRQTNVWNIHLQFSATGWQAIQHQQVPPVSGWMSPDGTPTLRNPKASRNGLSGVIGIDFPWSKGDVEFGARRFTNVAIRFKGNGTYLGGIRGYRKPFKLDLDKHAPGQAVAGRSIFNLGNLSADLTCLSDTLAYEFFRDAGVPAPRTAFARVFLSIAGQETNRLLGPYVMIENPDEEWAREVFAMPGVALFKPVTQELFSDLGTNWSDYDAIYDPKTPITPAQQARVMELARFVTQASDEEFAARVEDHVDLPETARFLASEVLLSNYDGILSNGQNFLFYLDPVTQRIGFIPWDLDHSWGEFPFVATAEDRERANIWRPWLGSHRFLERLMGVPEFKRQYREQLDRLVSGPFAPARLNRRVDDVAAALRPVIAEWSTNRLAKFDLAVSDEVREGSRDGDNPMDPNRPAWQLKRFIAARAANVRDQLDGRTEGVVLSRQPPKR